MKNNFQIFKFSNFVIALLFSITAIAQVDRSKAPTPNAAPIIKVAQPAKFVLPNGLKVYVVQNNKLPRVSASLSLDLEPMFEGEKAGVSSMAGNLMSAGTKTKSKDVLDEEIDFLGASLNTSSSSASVNSLTNNFNKAFELMADVVLNPSFPEDELEKNKKRSISGLEAEKEDANAILKKVSSKLIYGAKHPFGESETATSIEKITLADVKKYYNTYWKPNVAYLVFVGDITPANAQKLATQYFGKWKMGVLPKTVMPPTQRLSKNLIAIVDRPSSVQSVISIGNIISLKPGSADVIPASVMSDILGGGSTGYLYKNLREKHGFTYGAYAGVSESKYAARFRASASVRNEKTDSAIQEFMNEFKRIRNAAPNKEDVEQTKSSLAGDFARSFESPATIAQFALSTAINKLPPNYYQDYLSNLAKVNAATVQQMANKFVGTNNQFIVIVGNAKEIAKGLEKYGEIKYFDIDGNETKPSTTKAVSADITAESIINKYITAIGGETAIAAIKDVSMFGKMEIPQAKMTGDFVKKHITNSAYLGSISVMGGAMVIEKKSLVNGEHKVSGQMADPNIDEEDKEEMNEELLIINELYYIKNKYTMTVKGIESVDGKDAYEVSLKSAKGREFTNFYDVASGLKVKTIAIVDMPGAGKVPMPTYFEEYKAYAGVLMPTKVTVEQGVKMPITISEIKVNTGLKADDLK